MKSFKRASPARAPPVKRLFVPPAGHARTKAELIHSSERAQFYQDRTSIQPWLIIVTVRVEHFVILTPGTQMLNSPLYKVHTAAEGREFTLCLLFRSSFRGQLSRAFLLSP